MGKICEICLNDNEILITINENYLKNDNIIEKLQKIVPEVIWNVNLNLCNFCIEDVNTVCTFKEKCINSNLLKKNLSSDDDNCDYLDNEAYETDTEKIKIENVTFMCFHCNKIYDDKDDLQQHIEEEHCRKEDINELKPSEILKIKFKRTFKDKKLREDPQNTVNITPACSICGTTFSNKYLLKRHLKNVHATEKNYKCDVCNSTFASPVYLNAHKRYHTGERSHICSFCGKGFITASDLYHHEKIHANKRAYRCEMCPKAFNTSSDLHKHKTCVHQDRSKWKYVCSYCTKRFPLKTNLDTHIKTHTGEKNFACHLCERKCINKSVLLRHIETHTNVASFKCEICSLSYKYRKSLDVHMVKIHGVGDTKIPEKVKKYFCAMCPKSYFENNKLEKHVRTHTGERPFKCTECDKSFTDKSYVKQHAKTAHPHIVR